MATRLPNPPRILELAERLSADIRRRQLKPGDTYLTTAEAARLLGISTTTANRTLQLLTQRNVLARSQRKGSCVATPVSSAAAELRCVHLLARRQHVETRRRVRGWPGDRHAERAAEHALAGGVLAG